ncbi:MAG: methyltransferase domain-containing protein [Solirubrobacteraceae bacterium]
MPFGDPPRPHARCPQCGSLERQRVLWPHLRAILKPGDRVLHFAPEPIIARNIAALRGISYTAADLDPKRGWLSKDSSITPADITAQPWADESFSVVVVSHVLEHVPDDGQAMRELRRVVTSDGVVVSQHPRDPARAVTYEDPSVTSAEDRRRLFGQVDHVRIYGSDLRERWERAGFTTSTLRAESGPNSEIMEARPAHAIDEQEAAS